MPVTHQENAPTLKIVNFGYIKHHIDLYIKAWIILKHEKPKYKKNIIT